MLQILTKLRSFSIATMATVLFPPGMNVLVMTKATAQAPLRPSRPVQTVEENCNVLVPGGTRYYYSSTSTTFALNATKMDQTSHVMNSTPDRYFGFLRETEAYDWIPREHLGPCVPVVRPLPGTLLIPAGTVVYLPATPGSSARLLGPLPQDEIAHVTAEKGGHIYVTLGDGRSVFAYNFCEEQDAECFSQGQAATLYDEKSSKAASAAQATRDAEDAKNRAYLEQEAKRLAPLLAKRKDVGDHVCEPESYVLSLGYVERVYKDRIQIRVHHPGSIGLLTKGSAPYDELIWKNYNEVIVCSDK